MTHNRSANVNGQPRGDTDEMGSAIKEGERVTLKVAIKLADYSSLQVSSEKLDGDESAAVQAAIERGMKRWWLHWFGEIAEAHNRLKERYEQCRRDNRLLKELVDQNEELEHLVKTAAEGSR